MLIRGRAPKPRGPPDALAWTPELLYTLSRIAMEFISLEIHIAYPTLQFVY